MKFVSVIRRIKAIIDAIDRAPNEDKYDGVIDRLFDKLDILRAELKAYKRNGRGEYANRRKQILLACKLLGVSYYNVMHY